MIDPRMAHLVTSLQAERDHQLQGFQVMRETWPLMAQADVEKAASVCEVRWMKLIGDVQIAAERMAAEADIQRRRFALEVSLGLPLDPVVLGGAVG